MGIFLPKKNAPLRGNPTPGVQTVKGLAKKKPLRRDPPAKRSAKVGFQNPHRRITSTARDGTPSAILRQSVGGAYTRPKVQQPASNADLTPGQQKLRTFVRVVRWTPLAIVALVATVLITVRDFHALLQHWHIGAGAVAWHTFVTCVEMIPRVLSGILRSTVVAVAWGIVIRDWLTNSVASIKKVFEEHES